MRKQVKDFLGKSSTNSITFARLGLSFSAGMHEKLARNYCLFSLSFTKALRKLFPEEHRPAPQGRTSGPKKPPRKIAARPHRHPNLRKLHNCIAILTKVFNACSKYIKQNNSKKSWLFLNINHNEFPIFKSILYF